MADLVTLTEVKDALKIGTDDADATLGAYITAASEAVIDYLKAEPDPVSYRAKVAVIILVGALYDGSEEWDGVNMPPAAKSLLLPLRTPTLA